MRKGLSREDLFTVVHDPFMTDTAKYADIVLPAASYLETDDLYRAYGAYWMQWGRQAAKPQRRGALELRRGPGARQAHGPHATRSSPSRRRTRRKELFKGATGPAAAADPAKLFAGEPIHIAHDWNGQPFKTPSGKLEFYSEQLAKQGVSPMPDWNEDPVEVAEAAKWPLRLLTAPGYFQAHTAFSGVGFLRSREGKPFCMLHPEDAAKRGLKQGDEVRLFNDRGEIGLMLQVSDEIQPGVVLVPGQRPTGEAVSGTINMLCSDRYTDMGEGATYQSTWLDVGPWKTRRRHDCRASVAAAMLMRAGTSRRTGRYRGEQRIEPERRPQRGGGHREADRHDERHVRHRLVRQADGEAGAVGGEAGQRGAQCEAHLLHRRHRGGGDRLLAFARAAHDALRDERPADADAGADAEDRQAQQQRAEVGEQARRRPATQHRERAEHDEAVRAIPRAPRRPASAAAVQPSEAQATP